MLQIIGVRGGCTPGTAYVSSLHVRVGVCGWWGKPPWGRYGTRVCPLLLLLPLALPLPLCVCFVHVAWWRTGFSPGFGRTGVYSQLISIRKRVFWAKG